MPNEYNIFKTPPAPGFEEEANCQADDNECTANLCKNGGSCIDLPGNFR